MSETVYQEDACGLTGTSRYGHRREAGCVGHDSYGDDRLTGCSYTATDDPAIEVPAGLKYEMALQFRGRIVQVNDSGDEVKTIETIYWEVNCKGTAGPP